MAILFLLAVVSGCGSAAPGNTHTHVWVEDGKRNVWTYERVESIVQSGQTTEIAGYLSQELNSGDVVTLMNGSEIKYDGNNLMVDDHVVEVSNVQLESNGSVRENAFIKTD